MRSPLWFALLLTACGGEPSAHETLAPPAAGDGFQLAFDVEVPAGSERHECVVMELPIDGETAIVRATLLQNLPVHHVTVSVPVSVFVDLLPGRYDCLDVYRDHPEMMEATTLIGSQGERFDVDMPPGVAAVIPFQLRVMYEVHYINATPSPVKLWSRLNAYTAPIASITQRINGLTLRDKDITLPARAAHTEWSRCVMDTDVNVMFLATHVHALSTKTEVRRFDGSSVGELIYENDDWHAPKVASFAERPLLLRAGEGLELRCDYQNPRTSSVAWGPASTDEMCQLSFAYFPLSAAKCKVTATSDGLGLDP